MHTLFAAISAIVLGLPMDLTKTQDDQATPTKLFAAILQEYGPASGGMRSATTDSQRKLAVERMGSFPKKFVALAGLYPADPIALEALKQAVQAVVSADSAAQIAWEINPENSFAGCTDDTPGRTAELLQRDHLASEHLGPVIDRMRYGYRTEYSTCLRDLITHSPHRNVRALATLALARNLEDRLRMLQLVEYRPELARCCETVFGPEYLPAWERIGQVRLAAQIESLFEQASREFDDVKTGNGTVGQAARSGLYAFRNLRVGRNAPEIGGPDQDGVPFQLSDYRGNVVLLSFWSEY